MIDDLKLRGYSDSTQTLYYPLRPLQKNAIYDYRIFKKTKVLLYAVLILYQIGYWFRLIDTSRCWAKADADTQLTVFDSSASKKQLPFFL
jgi:hypothetical protein